MSNDNNDIKAHAEVTEAAKELLSIIEEQKAEIKRLRDELDECMNPMY